MEKRTYRYAPPEPLYPFGFGLSYTCFEYADLHAGPLAAGQALEVEVTVTNVGQQAGAEVVQVYLEYPPAAYPAPRRALAAFQRVELAAGESRRLAFSLPPQAWVVWDEAGHPRRLRGKHRLVVGGCSPGGRGQELGAPVPVSLDLT